MEKFKIKLHYRPKELEEVWPDNRFAYTIDCYTSSRIWEDSIIAQSLLVGMPHYKYRGAMKRKFDCAVHNYKLFFPNKNECEEAIEFIESLIILNKLS